jgi:hypothetical protein
MGTLDDVANAAEYLASDPGEPLDQGITDWAEASAMSPLGTASNP